MGKERARGRMLIVLLAVLALIAAACGGGGDEEGDAEGSEGAGGGSGEVSGSVTLLSNFTEEQDITGIENVIAAFNEQYPDAEILHEGSPNFEEQALTLVEGGNPPELMLIPQPGLIKDFFERGAALPLDFLDQEAIEEEYVPGVLQAGIIEDQLVGLPIRLSVKSLVWYRKTAFEENGYEVPETWEDMVALTDQMRSDFGGEGASSPWCVGIEDATATGWTLTDWIEDVMMRLHGGDVYDQWVGHEVEFQSPEVTQAFEQVADLWFPEGNVLGGQQNIVQTSFSAAPEPMFEDPPACLMHRQASFVQGSFPEDMEFGTDYDFFPLPPIEAGTGENAVLTAGDILVAFDSNPIVEAFAEFAATAEAQEAWAEAGSFLCSNATCSPDVYPDEALTRQGEMLANADIARFDASDLMPSQVGAGALWNEGTAWVAGEQELEPTLQAIDAAWPEGACGVGGVGPNCGAGSGTSDDASEAASEAGASEPAADAASEAASE